MKTILTASIILLVGLCLYLLFTRKPPTYQIGPTQKQLDQVKKELNQQRDNLVKTIAQLKNEKYTDSLRRAQENKLSTRTIKNLKGRIDSLKAELSAPSTKIDTIETQAAVIELQGQVIRKQDERIISDSLYISGLQINFDKRISAEQEQRRIAEEKLAIANQELSRKDEKIRKKTIGGWAKTGIIIGLSYLITRDALND